MKQEETKLNSKHAIAAATLNATSSGSLAAGCQDASPSVCSAAAPVGPRKRLIAGIGTDHRVPNEPLWPVCQSARLHRLSLSLGGVVTRQQSYLTVGNHPTSLGPILFMVFQGGQTNCRMTSVIFFFLLPISPFVILRTRRRLESITRWGFLTTDWACSGTFFI